MNGLLKYFKRRKDIIFSNEKIFRNVSLTIVFAIVASIGTIFLTLTHFEREKVTKLEIRSTHLKKVGLPGDLYFRLISQEPSFAWRFGVEQYFEPVDHWNIQSSFFNRKWLRGYMRYNDKWTRHGPKVELCVDELPPAAMKQIRTFFLGKLFWTLILFACFAFITLQVILTTLKTSRTEAILLSWHATLERFSLPNHGMYKLGVEQTDCMVMIRWLPNNANVAQCPEVPQVEGVELEIPKHPTKMTILEERYKTTLELGGHYKPTNCKARDRVALVIPYRDREKHLMMFLEYMHQFLQIQQIEYVIFVVELAPSLKFNRALLMNIGYVEAMQLWDFQCVIFHDVDLIPENVTNLYTCPSEPRHLSVAVNTLKYKLPHEKIFGGAVALTRQHFEDVNGFSNQYFGWGGEDDDLYLRLKNKNMNIIRYSPEVGRYTMMKHKPDSPSEVRWELLNKGIQRQQTDGLNSLKYKRLAIKFLPLYTHILVAFPTPEMEHT